MEHDLIVEQLLDQYKGVIENILQAPDLHNFGSASLAIFAQLSQVPDHPKSRGANEYGAAAA